MYWVLNYITKRKRKKMSNNNNFLCRDCIKLCVKAVEKEVEERVMDLHQKYTKHTIPRSEISFLNVDIFKKKSGKSTFSAKNKDVQSKIIYYNSYVTTLDMQKEKIDSFKGTVDLCYGNFSAMTYYDVCQLLKLINKKVFEIDLTECGCGQNSKKHNIMLSGADCHIWYNDMMVRGKHTIPITLQMKFNMSISEKRFFTGALFFQEQYMTENIKLYDSIDLYENKCRDYVDERNGLYTDSYLNGNAQFKHTPGHKDIENLYHFVGNFLYYQFGDDVEAPEFTMLVNSSCDTMEARSQKYTNLYPENMVSGQHLFVRNYPSREITHDNNTIASCFNRHKANSSSSNNSASSNVSQIHSGNYIESIPTLKSSNNRKVVDETMLLRKYYNAIRSANNNDISWKDILSFSFPNSMVKNKTVATFFDAVFMIIGQIDSSVLSISEKFSNDYDKYKTWQIVNIAYIPSRITPTGKIPNLCFVFAIYSAIRKVDTNLRKKKRKDKRSANASQNLKKRRR